MIRQPHPAMSHRRDSMFVSDCKSIGDRQSHRVERRLRRAHSIAAITRPQEVGHAAKSTVARFAGFGRIQSR